MFYSHQLLARKVPLGQIWMAATLRAKINRKRLDELDIIKICEEILNPSVPMALRLSGILMGGVVMVYERKVELLYADVSRLLIEINEAWPKIDPTLLPKGKAQAKYEAVTLPENMMDMEVDQPMLFSDANTARFRGMRLEDLDDQYVNVNLDDDDFSHGEHHHQTEAVNITLVDNFESGLAETDVFNRFERFDVADDDINVNPSPPRQEDPQQEHECAPLCHIQEESQQGRRLVGPQGRPNHGYALRSRGVVKQEDQKATKPLKRKAGGKGPQVIMDNQIMIPGNKDQSWLKDPSSLIGPQARLDHGYSLRSRGAVQQEDQKGQRPTKPSKRKACGKGPQVIMDNETIIPGNIYQTWLKDPSSLVSKRRRVSSKINFLQEFKISDLMDLPPVALMSYSGKPSPEFYYPKQLMQLWKKCLGVKSQKASSSGGNPLSSQEQQPRTLPPHDVPPPPQGEYQSEKGAQPPIELKDDIETTRGNKSPEYAGGYCALPGDALQDDHSVTPESPGLRRRSASSSGPGRGRGFVPLDKEVQLPSPTRRSKRRQHLSGRNLGNLDPAEEEFPLEKEARDFKLRRLSDIGPTPDLLGETEPTQTPYQKQSNPIDQVTESTHSYLKLHFDTPGAPQSESLDQLALGMTKARAARLFYQACVLATLDRIRVTQDEPYGQISMKRGSNM